MTDLILCELLGTNAAFADWFATHLGVQDGLAVQSIRRSVQVSLGETDVEVLCGLQGQRTALLIENKVRAARTKEQLLRYRLRGEDGRVRGLWDAYLVVLFSPAAYIGTLSAEESQLIDKHVSYEDVVSWLVADNAYINGFKIHVLEEGIADARIGYVKKLDSRMTDFHQGVHAIANAEFPHLKMGWVEEAGYDDSIIHLPYALPARGDKLLLKAKMGVAELRFETREPIAAERAVSTLVPSKWRTTRAKSYAGVEVAVAKIDPSRDFSTNEPAVRTFLAALSSLYDFYHLPEVSRVIELHRGSRGK